MILKGIWVNPFLPVWMDLSGLLDGWEERDYELHLDLAVKGSLAELQCMCDGELWMLLGQ